MTIFNKEEFLERAGIEYTKTMSCDVFDREGYFVYGITEYETYRLKDGYYILCNIDDVPLIDTHPWRVRERGNSFSITYSRRIGKRVVQMNLLRIILGLQDLEGNTISSSVAFMKRKGYTICADVTRNNLIAVTKAEANKWKRRNVNSGIRKERNGKYQGRMFIDGKAVYFKTCKTREEAILERTEALKRYGLNSIYTGGE